MKYECSVCKQPFYKKSHYNAHLQRKRPCKLVEDHSATIDDLKKRIAVLEATLESALANQQGSNITNTTNTNSHNNH